MQIPTNKHYLYDWKTKKDLMMGRREQTGRQETEVKTRDVAWKNSLMKCKSEIVISSVWFYCLLEMMGGLLCTLPELGVAGEFAWLACADTLAASTAVLTAYRFASSWNLPMFFLYRILLLPNQFETWRETTPIRQQFHHSERQLIKHYPDLQKRFSFFSFIFEWFWHRFKLIPR